MTDQLDDQQHPAPVTADAVEADMLKARLDGPVSAMRPGHPHQKRANHISPPGTIKSGQRLRRATANSDLGGPVTQPLRVASDLAKPIG